MHIRIPQSTVHKIKNMDFVGDRPSTVERIRALRVLQPELSLVEAVAVAEHFGWRDSKTLVHQYDVEVVPTMAPLNARQKRILRNDLIGIGLGLAINLAWENKLQKNPNPGLGNRTMQRLLRCGRKTTLCTNLVLTGLKVAAAA